MIRCGNCQDSHESVAEVRACHTLMNTPSFREATIAQINYAQALTRTRVPVHPVLDIEESNSIEAAHEWINGMDFDQISNYIGRMKEQPLREEKVQSALKPLVGEGMYRMDGVIYKVQKAVHGSGHVYAKRLDSDGFSYCPGIVTVLEEGHKMSLEECKEYGALYGTCCVCGRTLTNEQSIADGIGPICAGKSGWFR